MSITLILTKAGSFILYSHPRHPHGSSSCLPGCCSWRRSSESCNCDSARRRDARRERGVLLLDGSSRCGPGVWGLESRSGDASEHPPPVAGALVEVAASQSAGISIVAEEAGGCRGGCVVVCMAVAGPALGRGLDMGGTIAVGNMGLKFLDGSICSISILWRRFAALSGLASFLCLLYFLQKYHPPSSARTNPPNTIT